MYLITTDVLPLATARQRFGQCVPLPLDESRPEEAEFIALPRCQAEGDLASHTLVVRLPAEADDDLAVLARCPFRPVNWTSADLLSCRTCIQLVGDNIIVEFLESDLRLFFDGVYARKLRLVLVAGSWVSVSVHVLGEAAAEDLLIELSALTGLSGVNHKPWRTWTDEELADAQDLMDPPEENVVKAKCCYGAFDRHLRLDR